MLKTLELVKVSESENQANNSPILSQLTMSRRFQIEALKKEGLSQRAIALNIGVHYSTVCRELRRNTQRLSKEHIIHVTIYQYVYQEQIKGASSIFTSVTNSNNGKEFFYHQEISRTLDTDFYFAEPYKSWQRGLNEHTDGLIREYIPKKTKFETISDQFIST